MVVVANNAESMMPRLGLKRIFRLIFNKIQITWKTSIAVKCF